MKRNVFTSKEGLKSKVTQFGVSVTPSCAGFAAVALTLRAAVFAKPDLPLTSGKVECTSGYQDGEQKAALLTLLVNPLLK